MSMSKKYIGKAPPRIGHNPSTYDIRRERNRYPSAMDDTELLNRINAFRRQVAFGLPPSPDLPLLEKAARTRGLLNDRTAIKLRRRISVKELITALQDLNKPDAHVFLAYERSEDGDELLISEIKTLHSSVHSAVDAGKCRSVLLLLTSMHYPSWEEK